MGGRNEMNGKSSRGIVEKEKVFFWFFLLVILFCFVFVVVGVRCFVVFLVSDFWPFFFCFDCCFLCFLCFEEKWW